ncbi:Positive regulator of sigma E, RseC/MucC [Desulfamplus magnetovallimortis]|uniref:Positive regulator of sigma E, RseC/MucC n=1 Tax=Desulfamplus magnetovallimortis TaxID=1246637 RepID=A0A1W1H4Z9_9BACT|nr:SoxR reducing system RseC family protein [Desulfamplus magnetovallimortis]SLM27527.1 Positive regulator of sigma E, RseC/MucC [Desulfamplus magnetovallimortis]
MVTKEGVITGTIGANAWVKTVRSKSCESCESKDSCQEASKAQEMTIQLENTLNASIGDRVIVGFKTAPLLKITFLLYIFPVLMLIAGAATGDTLSAKINTDPSITSLLSGALCFAVSFGVIRLINNAWAKKKEFQPFLMRFTKKNENCQPS